MKIWNRSCRSLGHSHGLDESSRLGSVANLVRHCCYIMSLTLKVSNVSKIFRCQIARVVTAQALARACDSNADHPDSGQKKQHGTEPQQERVLPNGGLHQYKGAVPRHEEFLDLDVGQAALDLLTDKAAQIRRQGGVRLINRLALADETAQFLLERLRAGFEHGIGKRGDIGVTLFRL